MNEKEVAEIRRRFRPEKSNIISVRGCYVNEKREIVSDFTQSMALMPEDETEKLLSILKRTISGTLKKNLNEIEFTTQQVVQSEEHSLLMALRDSALKDEEAVQAFFQRAIQAIGLEGNYLILLARDTYDVPYRSQDGERQDDASSDVFSYILCSICPVKTTKPALSYYVGENMFHSLTQDWVVSPPELGFMFPTFDDRSANIYNALYYTRDITENHKDFVEAVFAAEAPMPAAEQKETFQAVLSDTLAEDCNLEVVQAVHNHLQEMMEVHKMSKEPEPLMVSKGTVRQILKNTGIAEEAIEAFDAQYDAEFGADVRLSPKNIVDSRQTKLTTPDVSIQVSPGCGDLVETRMIDGARYILIRAEDEVELNGIPIRIL